MRTLEYKLSKARSFFIGKEDGLSVYIELANLEPEKWCIRQEVKSILNKNGKWEYEPFPSNRTEEFIKRTRFNSLDEAWDFYDKYIDTKSP